MFRTSKKPVMKNKLTISYKSHPQTVNIGHVKNFDYHKEGDEVIFDIYLNDTLANGEPLDYCLNGDAQDSNAFSVIKDSNILRVIDDGLQDSEKAHFVNLKKQYEDITVEGPFTTYDETQLNATGVEYVTYKCKIFMEHRTIYPRMTDNNVYEADIDLVKKDIQERVGKSLWFCCSWQEGDEWKYKYMKLEIAGYVIGKLYLINGEMSSGNKVVINGDVKNVIVIKNSQYDTTIKDYMLTMCTVEGVEKKFNYFDVNSEHQELKLSEYGQFVEQYGEDLNRYIPYVQYPIGYQSSSGFETEPIPIAHLIKPVIDDLDYGNVLYINTTDLYYKLRQPSEGSVPHEYINYPRLHFIDTENYITAEDLEVINGVSTMKKSGIEKLRNLTMYKGLLISNVDMIKETDGSRVTVTIPYVDGLEFEKCKFEDYVVGEEKIYQFYINCTITDCENSMKYLSTVGGNTFRSSRRRPHRKGMRGDEPVDLPYSNIYELISECNKKIGISLQDLREQEQSTYFKTNGYCMWIEETTEAGNVNVHFEVDPLNDMVTSWKFYDKTKGGYNNSEVWYYLSVTQNHVEMIISQLREEYNTAYAMEPGSIIREMGNENDYRNVLKKEVSFSNLCKEWFIDNLKLFVTINKTTGETVSNLDGIFTLMNTIYQDQHWLSIMESLQGTTSPGFTGLLSPK